MSLKDLAKTALSNLGRHKVRTFLSAVGVTVGILTIVTMVSLGIGVQREIVQAFTSIGLETVEAYRGQLDLDKLVAYALHYGVGATIKRLGWALETLGAPESTIAPLRAHPVRAWAQLDPTGPPGGTPVAGWRLRNNLYSEADDVYR